MLNFCLSVIAFLTTSVWLKFVDASVVSERQDGFRHARSVTRKKEGKAAFSGELRDYDTDLPSDVGYPSYVSYSDNNIDSFATTFVDELYQVMNMKLHLLIFLILYLY